MDKIILQAMENCALRYAKGFPRWFNLWDEKLTVEQKALEISKELQSLGYELKRVAAKSIDTDKLFNSLEG